MDLQVRVAAVVLGGQLGVGAGEAIVDLSQTRDLAAEGPERLLEILDLGVPVGKSGDDTVAQVLVGAVASVGEQAVLGYELLDSGLKLEDLHTLTSTHAVWPCW